jgi:predicted metal-binding protein
MNMRSIRASSRMAQDSDLLESLEMIMEKARELGASDAIVIPAAEVVVSERVWMKCLVPRCRGLEDGGTPYCPPNTPKPEFMRKTFSQYGWAVLFKRDIENIEDHVPTSEADIDRLHAIEKSTGGYHDKTMEIVGRLESYAQSQGFYLAMGFGGGTCKITLCKGAVCGVVQNGTCRFPLKARPSMEAVGIDVFDLCGKVGWYTCMIRKVEPDLSVIPCAVSVGILFVC